MRPPQSAWRSRASACWHALATWRGWSLSLSQVRMYFFMYNLKEALYKLLLGTSWVARVPSQHWSALLLCPPTPGCWT